jgi:hypothetical protein
MLLLCLVWSEIDEVEVESRRCQIAASHRTLFDVPRSLNHRQLRLARDRVVRVN